MSSPFHINTPSQPAPAPSPLSQFVASAIAASGTPQNSGISPGTALALGLTPSASHLHPSSGLLNTSQSHLAATNFQFGPNQLVQAGQSDQNGDGLVSGLEGAAKALERMEAVLEEIEEVESSVFAVGIDEGAFSQRLESLHLEYTQLLLNLVSSSQINLFGALPVIKSTSELPPSTKYSAEDLTKWAEDRAGLEFGRREGLRAGGKAVLDVLSRK